MGIIVREGRGAHPVRPHFRDTSQRRAVHAGYKLTNASKKKSPCQTPPTWVYAAHVFVTADRLNAKPADIVSVDRTAELCCVLEFAGKPALPSLLGRGMKPRWNQVVLGRPLR